jgi:hypothetical protein
MVFSENWVEVRDASLLEKVEDVFKKTFVSVMYYMLYSEGCHIELKMTILN